MMQEVEGRRGAASREEKDGFCLIFLMRIISSKNCITRLRVNVKDESKINEDTINLTQNSGIVRKGKDIQIIFGLHVPEVRRAVEDYIEAY